ncbi:MAG TPA: efflux RND transporter periplasmic adaptor subunit [Longimicrobiaceae bacterium]|nr:efflux RND transporter periplasmic adaptor subunit [Longimicrobiaceae bacterium]
MSAKQLSRRAAPALALAAALAAGACGRESDAAPPAQPDAVAIGPENVLVLQVEELRSGPAISGTLTAAREAQVRAEVAGTVLQVFAEKGQPVGAGAALARIDDSSLGAQHLSAQSAVRTAEAALDMARRNAERTQTLASAGAIAERDLEQARVQVSSAQAQLANARAMLAQAQKQLAKTSVRSPISGIVSDRPVSAGDVVQPGAALFTVIDPGSMRLEGSVPAAQLGELKVGAPVRFTVSGYAEAFTGRIERINPAADPATRQVPVLVSVPNQQGRLVAGLFAQGRVESATRQGIAVPPSAVDERGVQPTVVVLRQGKAARVPVRLGLRDPDTERVEIVSGVAAGDTLLIGAALGTSEGTPITVSPKS